MLALNLLPKKLHITFRFPSEMLKKLTRATARKGNGWRFALSLAIPCIFLIFAVFRINTSAVEKLLVQDSRAQSIVAIQYFEDNLPKRMVGWFSAYPTYRTKAIVRNGLKNTGVERFKRYDADGRFVLDSAQMEGAVAGEDQLGSINEEAIAAIVAGTAQVTLQEKSDEMGERLIAETYVTVTKAGKIIGVAEVYTDQTANAARLHLTFTWYSAIIAGLAALGFAVPAIAFYIRNRQKIAADENVQFLANHDVLTKLHNRASFAVASQKQLKVTLQKSQVAIVHFLDLDGFKEINDRQGHGMGDEVLRIIGERLRHTLREGDIAARFGGDEFVVAQFGFSTNEQIHAATARIADVFKNPLQIDGKQISITASIGTAVSPQHGTTIEDLIERADTSVYVVKARGRNAQCYFESRFDEDKKAKMKLEDLLRKAVSAKTFHLNFQPLINFKRDEVKGFEALLRLRNESGKAISPAEFIPVAEELGLIDQIGCWVLEQSCLTAANWPLHMQISVNLSVSQFKNRSVVTSTKSALAKSRLEPHRLLLEITESLLMTETESILSQLRELKALGVSIVMDDFGTGYSSLGYMLKFPFDCIKIDRSFVQELGKQNAEADNVVQTIISLGHSLRMSVTAEGVETQAQVDALRAMGCDDAQGFLYGRPLPAADIPPMLMKALRDKTRGNDEMPINLRAQA